MAETLTTGPPVVLVSRPFDTLSPVDERGLRSSLVRLRGGVRGAVIFIARSVGRTLGLNSHVYIVGSKGVIRINAPRRLLTGPSSFIQRFIKRRQNPCVRKFDLRSVLRPVSRARRGKTIVSISTSLRRALGLLTTRSRLTIRRNKGVVKVIGERTIVHGLTNDVGGRIES